MKKTGIKSKKKTRKLTLPMSESEYYFLKKKAVKLGYEEIEEFLKDLVFKKNKNRKGGGK